MNKKLVLGLALFSLTSFGVLTACSKKESVKPEPKEIIVATNANSKPNTYMEDNMSNLHALFSKNFLNTN